MINIKPSEISEGFFIEDKCGPPCTVNKLLSISQNCAVQLYITRYEIIGKINLKVTGFQF